MLPCKKLLITISLILVLASCAALSNIGKSPEMTVGGSAPTHVKTPDLSNLRMPMKNNPLNYAPQPNGNPINNQYASLWQSGPESLFGDRRAKNIGDIMTVDIEIDDRAEFNNKTERARDSSDKGDIAAGFGLDGFVDKFLPEPLSIKPGIETTGQHSTKGEGKINRREKIKLKIAAVVTNILPNGNFVIQGSQEVNVNYELRDLQITGIVRPHDISRRNTISYEKIAEARIYYGGRGNVSQLQQPHYGTQFFDIVSPF